MNNGGLSFPYNTQQYNGYGDSSGEDEETRFERELQMTIEESIRSEKRKRQLAADEELAKKLQLEQLQQLQQQEQQDDDEEEEKQQNMNYNSFQSITTSPSWVCPACTFVNNVNTTSTTRCSMNSINSDSNSHSDSHAMLQPVCCEMCGSICELSVEPLNGRSNGYHCQVPSYNGDSDHGNIQGFVDTATTSINDSTGATDIATTSSGSGDTSNNAATIMDHNERNNTNNNNNNNNNNDDDDEEEDYMDLLQLHELQDYWNAKEESLLVASKIWTCVTCHKVNEANVNLCAQCLEPKAASTNPNSGGTIHSQHHVHVQDLLWPCSKCTFDNSYDDNVCFMCGHAIPERYHQLRLQNQQNSASKHHGRPSECGMPGCCQRAVHYGFCSKVHMDLALRKNIIPPSEPGVEAVLVGHTGDYTAHLLRTSHPKHASVKKQFLDSWKKTDEGYPRVQRIYWIRMRPEILESFDLMKLQLGNCNVQRMFHGTSQSPKCYFGTNPLKVPCLNDPNCRVCCIIRNSFDLVHVKRGEGGQAWAHQTQQLRYGEGMYFSPVSSKSNDYNRLSERKQKGKGGEIRRWKCMFLCNVVLGKQHRTTEGFLPKEQCPPEGYDSVWGETGPNLNYDEACVYNANQAIPSYLIVYSLRS